MGKNHWPPISQADFARILRINFGGEPDRKKGDHEKWSRIATHGVYAFANNDTGRDPVFGRMIEQAVASCNVTREQFYGMLKTTARAAQCVHLKDGLPKAAMA